MSYEFDGGFTDSDYARPSTPEDMREAFANAAACHHPSGPAPLQNVVHVGADRAAAIMVAELLPEIEAQSPQWL